MDSTEENNGCLSASDNLAHYGSSTSGYPVEKLDDTTFHHRLGKVQVLPTMNSELNTNLILTPELEITTLTCSKLGRVEMGQNHSHSFLFSNF